MRKLAWFVIALLLVVTIIAVACAVMPSVSAAVYDIGVNVVGRTIVNWITGLMTGMMAWGTTGLAPAAAVFFGVGIGFTVLWLVVLRKYIWNPLRGAVKPDMSTTEVSMQRDVSPVPLKNVEQKKEEPIPESK